MNDDALPVPESVPDSAPTSPEPLPVEEIARLSAAIIERVATVVVGMSEAVEVALASILAGGHVLFEDVPGLGKTLAARSLASALGLEFRRLQCTPDLLPSDITGSFVYAPGHHRVRVPSGPGVHRAVPGRRDQPDLTQDPVGAAGGDGRGAGDRRGAELPAAVPVSRRRHLQSDRVRGDLRAAGGPARQVHGALGCWLPRTGR